MPKVKDPEDAAIGNRVRAARQIAHVSQEKLAAHLGVTFQQVQKYEGGVNRISASRLLKITAFLGADFVAVACGGTPEYDVGKIATHDMDAARKLATIPNGRAKIALLHMIDAMAPADIVRLAAE